MQIRCAVTAQLICVFNFAYAKNRFSSYAKNRFSRDKAHINNDFNNCFIDEILLLMCVFLFMVMNFLQSFINVLIFECSKIFSW